MSKVYFLLCIHNHQPVGNFENVIEEAYQKAYKPFVDVMLKYPWFKFTLHCSGILWDYFVQKHKEYIEIIKQMLKNGQVEIISGGYYEPILCSIPEPDRIGQIKMMNEFIYNTFGVEPKGLWLTERIWEQNVVKNIVDCGIKYTLVDDYIFYSAGINKKENPELTDYYLTEEEGRILYVFPISQTLRYYIPFKEPKEVISFFSKFSGGHPQEVVSLTMGDDGEKFGIWPKTYEHVYQNGWLEKFIQLVKENESWFSTLTMSEYIKLKPPKQRIYLPTASYFEMGEWTLPVSTQEMFEYLIKNLDALPQKEIVFQFLRGGYWKNFLSKYPESNNMHKKMLYVSELVKKSKNEELKKNLYKAQCNCAYWHGVFGGLYLPHLRNAVYEHLISVEKSLVKNGVYVKDFDKDGADEIALHSDNIGMYIKPSYGGSVYEIDLKKYNRNILNVLSRKKEAYHSRLVAFENNNFKTDLNSAKTIHDIIMVKEPGLSKKLFYDWHLRYSFLDHFLHHDTKLENFYRSQYGEQGNFTIESYVVDKIKKKQIEISLYRIGNVWYNNAKYDIKVIKTYRLEDSIVKCNYSIQNLSDKEVSLWFLTELNLLVFTEEQQQIKEFMANVYTIKDIQIGDIEIIVPNETLFWVFPIETISLSEAGFERTYQGLCVAVSFKFLSQPNKPYTIEVQLVHRK